MVVFEQNYFDFQLRLLFQDQYQLTVMDERIVLKIKPNSEYLLDNQRQLIALASSFWRHERYCVKCLFSLSLQKIAQVDHLIHEIEVLVAKQGVFSADCYTYVDNVLIAKSSIVCEQIE